ncbi:MAG: S-layer protein, partial [Pedosphaera sp. Tous-C6FEB]
MGQNGFQLSLLGFEPQEDYEHLVKEGRGRRVFAASPEQSLVLMKASARVPHGGGLRLDPASEGYRILRAWLQQGTPNDITTAPKLVSLDVQPARKTLKPKAEQQLKVTARFADGKSRDVTSIALYEANDRNMAETIESGRVKILDIPGNVAVMVRYQDKAGVFNVSVPLGATVKHLPPTRNFIDQHVFANLKQLGIPPSPVCDDATFLRRVSLDIAGRLPTTAEAEAFLASKDPAKRDQLVDALLTSPDYADFFANKWTALLKNKRDDTKDITANFAFHSWVR